MDKASETAKKRASRLKRVRELADLSTKRLADIAEIGESTIRYWESGKAGGLTDKGAKKIAKGLSNYGIDVSSTWLMEEIGMPPQYISKEKVNKTPEIQRNDEQVQRPPHIERLEGDTGTNRIISAIEDIYGKTLNLIIPDSSMEPLFFKNDLVIGIALFGAQIDQLDNKACIVKNTKEEVRCRKLNIGPTHGLYTISSINTGKDNSKIEYDIPVLAAAEITIIIKNYSHNYPSNKI